MKLKTKTLLFLFAALIFLGLQKDVALAGFGVSPPTITNTNLTPGSTFEQDIVLVQGTPDVDMNVAVVVDAGKINSWIKIENGNTFIIPKGTQQFPMKVDVTVPADAQFGEYKGNIIISTKPLGAPKSGVSVVLGGNVKIDLTVASAKVSNFLIQNFQIPDVAKGSQVKFVVKVNNEGNVENGPTKVDLTFFDQYHSKQLDQQTQTITQKVSPFQVKDISINFPNKLDVGSYWADVKIYSGDTVAVSGKLVFNVIAPLSAAKQQKSSGSDSSGISMWIYWLIAVVVIILVVVLIRVVISRKSEQKNIDYHYHENKK